MPFGLSKEMDTPENNAFIERCHRRVMKENPSYDKGRAITICKNALKERGSTIEAEQFIDKKLNRGK